jgi:nucleoside-triphosphatase
MPAIPAPLVILTGKRGVGKSTVCARVRSLVVAQGFSCGGLLTWRDLDASGATIGLFIEDAATGVCRRLASTREDLGGPRVGPFSMDETALAHGVELVRAALAANPGPVFLDELGPLELERGLGLAPTIPLATMHPRAAVILVVRPALVQAAVRQLAPRLSRVENVTRENRDLLPRRLAAELLASGSA